MDQKEEGTGHVVATIGLVTCSVMAVLIAAPGRLVDDDDDAAAAAALFGQRSAASKLGASVADVAPADYPVVIDQPFCAVTLENTVAYYRRPRHGQWSWAASASSCVLVKQAVRQCAAFFSPYLSYGTRGDITD